MADTIQIRALPKGEEDSPLLSTDSLIIVAERIPQAAALISKAFRHDALIDYLRPGSAPWEENAVEWQRRRVEAFRLRGHVFEARMAGNDDVAGLFMLYEPGQTKARSLLDWTEYLAFLLRNKLDPKPDVGIDPAVGKRRPELLRI